VELVAQLPLDSDIRRTGDEGTPIAGLLGDVADIFTDLADTVGKSYLRLYVTRWNVFKAKDVRAIAGFAMSTTALLFNPAVKSVIVHRPYRDKAPHWSKYWIALFDKMTALEFFDRFSQLPFIYQLFTNGKRPPILGAFFRA